MVLYIEILNAVLLTLGVTVKAKFAPLLIEVSELTVADRVVLAIKSPVKPVVAPPPLDALITQLMLLPTRRGFGDVQTTVEAVVGELKTWKVKVPPLIFARPTCTEMVYAV